MPGNEYEPTEYTVRKMLGIPRNWRERDDSQVMGWARALSTLTIDAVEDLESDMWDELAMRDGEREQLGGLF